MCEIFQDFSCKAIVLDFLLCPLQISLNVLGGFHALSKVCSGFRQACSCLGLECEDLAIFGVEFSRPVMNVSRWDSLLDGGLNSHLRLPRQMFVERNGIVSLRKSIIHVVEQIYTGRTARGVIVAARVLARSCRVQAATR